MDLDLQQQPIHLQGSSLFSQNIYGEGRIDSSPVPCIPAATIRLKVFINGVRVGTVDDWKKPKYVDVTRRIVPGENVLAVRCENEQSTAGLIVRLQMTMLDDWRGAPGLQPDRPRGIAMERYCYHRQQLGLFGQIGDELDEGKFR